MPDGSNFQTHPDQDALAASSLSERIEAPPEAAPARAVHRGRGAVTNPASRFDRQSSTVVDDGWPS